MQISANTNPLPSYVTLTRVEKNEDLVIYRDFAGDFSYNDREENNSGLERQQIQRRNGAYMT